MRLLYLDETGTTSRAEFLAVSGVMVHGDKDWPEIDALIVKLIEKYIPEPDRPGFVFHATDIFHGSGYFDRRKPEWDAEEKRWPILLDLAQVINALGLPVVAGFYRKDKFGVGVLADGAGHAELAKHIHSIAALDCLIWADRWLERYAPDELATVVHEDGTDAKSLIKLSVRLLRNDHLMAQFGITEDAKAQFGLPLKRIIDTVHFAEKPDARPLQLADLCAFTLGRTMHEKAFPQDVFNIVWRHLRWITTHANQSRLSLGGDGQ